jgi:hypothetical protein
MGTAVTLALLAAAPAQAQAPARTQQAQQTSKQAIDPQAVAALERMGSYLRAQSSIKLDAEMTTDDLLPSGQKVQYGGTAQLKVRRPDRLRADVVGDRKNEQMFYDGKTFTIFQPRLNYYARFDAPPTLAELVDLAEKRYGIDLPVADLFYWGTDKSRIGEIRAATKVGSSTVRGVACDHYAFRQTDVDWEICIEPGGRPLPRKLVITTTAERAQPQHQVVMNWDLNPRLNEQDFTFTPPPTAHRIEFQPASPPAGTPRHGRTPKRGVTP